MNGQVYSPVIRDARALAVSLVPDVGVRSYARAIRPFERVIPDPQDRAVVTAEEAFAELGIDRSTGYKAIREGTFPLPVIRIGRVIRVPTVALRQLLQLDGDVSGPDRTDVTEGARD